MARTRQQQTEIPGTERREIPAVEEAAETYRAYRDERMDLAEKEAAAKKALIAAGEAHGLSVYRYVDSEGVDRRVIFETKKNAKVGKVKGTDGGGSADGDSTPDVSVQ